MSGFFDSIKNFIGQKFADMEKPEAAVTNVDLKGVHLGSVDYLANVSVKNPYSVPIPICEISYVLKSVDRVIASGKIPDPGNLAADDETILDVPVKVPNSVLLSLITDVCRDWDIDYVLDLGLIFDLPVVGNITIPVSQSGQIKLPTISDLF